jgi:hypothetical protein
MPSVPETSLGLSLEATRECFGYRDTDGPESEVGSHTNEGVAVMPVAAAASLSRCDGGHFGGALLSMGYSTAADEEQVFLGGELRWGS